MSDSESVSGELVSAAEIAADKERKGVELRRAQLKAAAYRRAQISLKHAFERIDYTLDVVEVEKKQIANEAAQGELPVITITMED